MSIQNSYLAQPKYSYDMVVATSQKALNNAVENFYKLAAANKIFTQQVCYFVKDGSGNPVAIDKTSLLAKTNNVDPLTVPAWSGIGTMPADVSSVINIGFYFAFQFTPGNPAGTNDYTYLTINPGTQSVDYYLLSIAMQVVFWNPDTKAWVNVAQSKGPKEFNINANVNLKNVPDNANLPPAVQAEVNNLGNTDVNVQQLLLDFDSAVVNPTTTLPGLDPASSVFKPIMQQYAASYFAVYEATEVPRLNYAITQQNSSSLIPNSIEFYAGALVDDNGNPVPSTKDDAVADLSTINYLFSVNKDTLPAPVQFNWNWLEDNGVSPTPDTDINADVNIYSGAIAINRDTFAKYLHSKLLPYVLANCMQPSISVGDNLYVNEWDVIFTQGTLEPLANGFQPFDLVDVEMDGSDTLLTYMFSGSQRSNGWQSEDYLSWQNYFMLNVVVSGQTLTIAQTMQVNIDTVWSGGYPGAAAKGTPVNRSYTDVFAIVIDDNGVLNLSNTKSTPAQADDTKAFTPSQPPANIIGSLSGLISSLSTGNFQQIPVAMPKTFVFPGGDAFTFKDAQFSKCSDLVCHVTYLSED